MRRNVVGTILVTLLVVGALGAAGYGLFQIGYQQGLVASGAEVVVQNPAVAAYPGFHPGFWGFGFFGIFFKVLFFFLIFGLIARLFFGRRRWGWGPGYYGGGHGWHGEGLPIEERMNDWHQHAHDQHGADPEEDG